MFFTKRKMLVCLLSLFSFPVFSSERSLYKVPPYFWEFRNSLALGDYELDEDSYSHNILSFTSGLFFTKPFSYFSVSTGFFLTLGPFTSSEKDKYKLDFMGFGGAVSISRDLDFFYFSRNISLSLDFLMSQIFASSPDALSSQAALDLNFVDDGENFNHRVSMRRPFLGLSLSYSFPESFSRMIKSEEKSKSYGQRVSLSYLFSLKGYVKTLYQVVTNKDQEGFYKEAQEKLKKNNVKGNQIVLTYHLSFL